MTTFVFGLLENTTASLNDLVEFCEDHCGMTISVQALDGRIHQATLTFMKQMFSLALVVFRQTVRLPVPILSQFSAVNITDSTGISLPESVAEEFPGSGGAASTKPPSMGPASMKSPSRSSHSLTLCSLPFIEMPAWMRSPGPA